MPEKQTQRQFDWESPRVRLLTPAEIYSGATASMLLQISEDKRLERKPPNVHRQELSEYFSMWANTPPDGGVIIVGMSDPGEFVGLSKLSDQQINQLEQAPEHFCPDARARSKKITVQNIDGNQDQVLLFYIPYRDDVLVETTKGKAFRREGDSKFEIKDAEKDEIRQEKGQSQEQEQRACGLQFPDDFDIDAIRRFAEIAREAWDYPDTHTVREILQLRRLGRIDGENFVANEALALLFAKTPLDVVPGCKIRFLRFDGDSEGTGDKWNAVKDIWIEGTVPELILKAEKVLEAQLRDFGRLAPDGKFYLAPEYPKAAWYEAIVNACGHRSYGLRNMTIFVKMFDSKLIVESPGSFPPFVTPENIFNMHNPRNRALMEAMYHLDFVKCAHEGTRRMRDTMLELSLPKPEFSERSDLGYPIVRVQLRNSIEKRKLMVDADVISLVGEAISKSLSERERRLINFVAEYESINASQGMRLLGCNWHTAKEILTDLANRSILEHVKNPGHDTRAHFVLKRSV